MSLYKIQGKAERQQGIYYEFNSEDKPLGEGGMGKVYKGRCVDEKSGQSRDVAIKFIYSDLPSYAIEKARREASIHFRHENLVEMLGFIETESKSVIGEPEKHYHVVSELLEGVSLDSLLTGKFVNKEGQFIPYAEKLFKDFHHDPNRTSINIIKCILSGLMTMHDAGYIHRDIDPTNIMVTIDGRIKLIDFGIAKKFNALTSHDKHLTHSGQFVGKPEYAAPELVLGSIDEQNQTTDIYSVGILLFQLIVGHQPFEGDRSDVLHKQLHSPIPLKLVKHKGLRKIIAKATEKTRSKRYQSAAEFRVDLDRVLLTGGNNIFEWKPLYTYCTFGVIACAAAFVGINKFGQTLDTPPGKPDSLNIKPPTTTPQPISYGLAVNKLHNQETFEEGINKLESLSNSGNSEASFLLSRLYFRSLKAGDYCPDSIKRLQDMHEIKVDNGKAHKLLELAVEQNPDKYQALYELACDYLGGSGGRLNEIRHDIDKADKLFLKALDAAKANNDRQYISLIETQMAKYQGKNIDGKIR